MGEVQQAWVWVNVGALTVPTYKFNVNIHHPANYFRIASVLNWDEAAPGPNFRATFNEFSYTFLCDIKNGVHHYTGSFVKLPFTVNPGNELSLTFYKVVAANAFTPVDVSDWTTGDKLMFIMEFQ